MLLSHRIILRFLDTLTIINADIGQAAPRVAVERKKRTPVTRHDNSFRSLCSPIGFVNVVCPSTHTMMVDWMTNAQQVVPPVG